MKNKWNSLQLKVCESLVQSIEIPEFEINERLYRESHLDNSTHVAIIYVIRKKSPKLRLRYLCELLALYFDAPKLGPSMSTIVTTPLDEAEEIVANVWKLDNLPPTWEENSSLPSSQLKEDTQKPSESAPDSELSIVEAEEIMNVVDSAFQMRDIEEFWTETANENLLDRTTIPQYSTAFITRTNSDVKDLALGIEEIAPIPDVALSDGSNIGRTTTALKYMKIQPSLNTPTTFSDYHVSATEDSNIKSGFAGELFVSFPTMRNFWSDLQVFRYLKARLPGFSDANWTSGLRRYANLPPCKEGLSDFVYAEDMEALIKVFNLFPRKSWKMACIEVKSTVGTDNSFILSRNQFLRVRS